MKRITTFLLGATLPLACLSSATADDTDLYLTPNTPISAQPLVMFTIDYVPSLTSTVSNCGDASSTSCEAGEYFRASQYDDVKAAIAELGTGKMQRNDLIRLSLLEAFHSLDGQIKAGLMMSHKDGGGCNGPGETNCTNGGYIVSGFKTLGDDPATVDTNEGAANAAAFVEILKSIPDAKGSISHDYQGAEMYFEFFRYLTGQKVYNGRNGWESFNSNGDDDVNLNVEFPAFSWDESILKNVTENEVSTTWYVSPFAAKDCSKVYVINIMKQNATKDADSEAAMEAALTSGGLGVSVPSNGTFEAVVERMRTMDLADGTFGKAGDIAGQQNVLSYFLTEFDNTKTQGYARAGGTGEPLIYTDDPSTIVTALEKVFKEILSVSTTFVAASVPVNVFNRSESLDNVFIALFQVDELAKPFWAGNLKKLKILEDANGIYLADANDEAAISETDGRINYEALTYWTVGGSLPPPEGEFEVAGKDGRSVERGGAGQKIPGFLSGSPGTSNLDGTARQLFYDPESVTNGNATTLLPLNMDDTTATDLQAALGAADTLTAKKLIGYARGLVVNDDGTTTGEARPWLLGDALHSRPLPINYGLVTSSNLDKPDIYIAMGAQDGFMHFFRNTSGTDGSVETGEEVWAFMPREVMDGVSVYQANTDIKNHPYMVDGAPAVYLDDGNDGTIDTADGDRAILYFGLRRGGKVYYALDVSDPTTPKILWRIEKTVNGNFDELGQTWSTPRVGKVDLDGPTRMVDGIETGTGEPIPVVIFGGGYDTDKDTRDDPATTDVNEGIGTNDQEGNAIYVVNALTGELVWKAVQGTSTDTTTIGYHAKMLDGIPSDVTVVDTDGNGESDRVLVGDTGGRVWRVDIGGARSNWQVSLLGEFGSDATAADDRRFFHRPDFVQSKDGPNNSNKFDAVIIGSGDRPNPFDRDNTGGFSSIRTNWTFMIKDRRVLPASETNAVADTGFIMDSLLDVTNNCLQTGTTGTCDPDNKLQNGWKLMLSQGTGEKSLSTPITLANTVYFTTYLPFGEDTDVVGDVTAGVDFDTCGPSEGEGLLYAVSLADATAVINYNEYNDTTDADGNTTSETLDASDRTSNLSSHGIPADVVGVNIGGRAYILPPDLDPDKAGDATRWRTFWYSAEDGDNY